MYRIRAEIRQEGKSIVWQVVDLEKGEIEAEVETRAEAVRIRDSLNRKAGGRR